MAAVNQVKKTEFEFSLTSNLVVNINEGYCVLLLANESNERKFTYE